MIAWAIEALVASTLLMLLVLVLRAPVRAQFGAGVAYALWVLPVARLALPPLPSAWRDEASAPIARASETITVLVVEPLTAAPAVSSAAATPAASSAPSLAMVILALWAAGAAGFLLWHAVAHARFCRRILAAARTIVRGPVNVVETDAATGPLAFGIVRKYVAFPGDFQDRYDADERDLALEHELTHHRRGDLIANWIALVVLALHWFNPIAWRAFRAFRADQEMACDARVLAGRDPAFRHAYGRAIVKSAHGGAVSAACHLHTINELKGRLKMLSMGRKSRLRVVAGTVSVAALTLGALGLTASGTQAAERLRTKVGHTIGVDIASLDAAVATAPSAPAASGTGEAQAAPAAPVPPAPPSAAAPEAAPVPPEAPAGAVPPAPPAPPAADDQRYQWTDKDGKTRVVILRKHRNGPGSDSAHDVLTDAEIAKLKADGGPMIRKRIIIRDRDGKVVTDDLKGMPDIPEVTSANCAGDGNPHQTVLHGEKGGRRTIIICTNRIDKLAAEASQMAANSKDIERRAYQSALTGLRAARDKAGVRDNAEALKGIDEAIAEIEQDLAKLD